MPFKVLCGDALRELTPVLGGYLILFFEDFRNFKKLQVAVFPNPSKNWQFLDKAQKEPIVLRLFGWFIENLRTTITLSESAFWTFTTKVMKSKNCPQNRPLLIPTQHWLMSFVQFLIPTKIPVWSCVIRQPPLEALCKIKVLKQQFLGKVLGPATWLGAFNSHVHLNLPCKRHALGLPKYHSFCT